MSFARSERPNVELFRHCNLISQKDGSSPITNLPTELLSRIFQFGIEHTQNLMLDDRDSSGKRWAEERLGIVYYVNDKMNSGSQSFDDACIPHTFPIIVSHVCQHWRNVAISTASLWTSITVSPASQSPYPYVVASLERSKRLPIDILVYSRPEEYRAHSPSRSSTSVIDLKSLYSLLVAHVRRWHSVEVRGVSIQHMYTFVDAVSYPNITAAPQLTSLTLSTDTTERGYGALFWSPARAGNSVLFGGSIPCLKRLSLSRQLINWSVDWISCAPHLTTLRLQGHPSSVCPTWDEFTTILRNAPALETLFLQLSGPRGYPPNLDGDPKLGEATRRCDPIPLVKLTHLFLLCQPRDRVYGLLRTLYTPSIKHLTLDAFWDDYTQFLHYIAAPATVPVTLSEARPHSLLHSLESFDIRLAKCPVQVIEALYDELENTKLLKISMDNTWYNLSGCVLILPLFPPAAVPQDSVLLRLPHLEKLFISDVSSNHHFQVIRQVVQQRGDAGFPLRSLYIERRCDVNEEDMVVDAGDVAWLEENMETFVFPRQCARW